MKFEIHKNALERELACLQGLVGKKGHATLTHAAFDVKDGKLRIAATDLESTIVSVVSANVAEAGGCCIPAAKLYEIVRLLGETQITISLEDNDWTRVTSGTSKFRLPGLPRSSFPVIPPKKPTSLISVPSDVFKLLIARTAFAIPTNEDTRYALQGLKLLVDAEGVTLVGTDGQRLAVARAKLAEEPLDDLDTIIPASALAELQRLTADYSGAINISRTDDHLYLQLGARLLISTLLTGLFPDYTEILPRGDSTTATFDTEALSLGLRRAATVSHKRTLKLVFSGGGLQIIAKDEGGDAIEIVALEGAPELEIMFDYRFLLDFIDSCGLKKVALDMQGPGGQAQLRGADDEADGYCRYVVMPMTPRLNGSN